MSDSNLQQIHQLLKRDFGLAAKELQLIPPGMSGASVYRLQTEDERQFALKCWPPNTEPTRVAEVHRVVIEARHNGCMFVPRIVPPPDDKARASSTLVLRQTRIWELCEWMAGSSLTHPLPIDQVVRGAAAICRFHETVRSIDQRVQVARAVQDRCRRVAEISKAFGPDSALRSAAPDDFAHVDAAMSPARFQLRQTLELACHAVRTNWPAVSALIQETLTPFLSVRTRTQYIVRDLRREHLLFDQGEVSGLIDFDAVRIDTPAADLARWTGDLIAVNASSINKSRPFDLATEHDETAERLWSAVLAGYRQQGALSEQEEHLARRLLYGSIWISMANWVIWLTCEHRHFAAGETALAQRLSELLTMARLVSPDFVKR